MAQSYTRALVDQVKQGDRERFEELFDRIAPALYSWAGLRLPEKLHKEVEAEDVVQEVWRRALVRFRDFDPERARFRSWIFGIGKNVLMEVFKSVRGGTVRPSDHTASVFRPEDIPTEATAVSQRVARDLQLKEFNARVQALDPEDRELLILRGLEELSHEQIAVHLGINEDAAQKRWVRLRDRLRQQGLPEGVIETVLQGGVHRLSVPVVQALLGPTHDGLHRPQLGLAAVHEDTDLVGVPGADGEHGAVLVERVLEGVGHSGAGGKADVVSGAELVAILPRPHHAATLQHVEVFLLPHVVVKGTALLSWGHHQPVDVHLLRAAQPAQHGLTKAEALTLAGDKGLLLFAGSDRNVGAGRWQVV